MKIFLNESMNTSIQKCRSLFILSLPGVALTLSCLVFRQWTRGPIHLNSIEETNLFLPSTSLPSLTSLVLRSLLFSLLAQLIFSEWTRAYSKIFHRHIRHFIFWPSLCIYLCNVFTQNNAPFLITMGTFYSMNASMNAPFPDKYTDMQLALSWHRVNPELSPGGATAVSLSLPDDGVMMWWRRGKERWEDVCGGWVLVITVAMT